MIVAISNIKGGVGKTTTAMGLATAAARRGLASSVVDIDPSAASSAWAAEADGDGNPLPFSVTPGNTVTLKSLAPKEDEWVFIDCPPGGGTAVAAGGAAVAAADFVVVPSQATSADVLEMSGKPYAIVITRAVPAEIGHRETMAILEESDASYFETVIPQRAGIKRAWGCNFGADLYGYDALFEELEGAVG